MSAELVKQYREKALKSACPTFIMQIVLGIAKAQELQQGAVDYEKLASTYITLGDFLEAVK